MGRGRSFEVDISYTVHLEPEVSSKSAYHLVTRSSNGTLGGADLYLKDRGLCGALIILRSMKDSYSPPADYFIYFDECDRF